jgi:hypothetical protein
MYQQIVNPETGRKVNIFSKLGKKILNNYTLQIGGASLTTTNCVKKGKCRGPGKKCRKADNGCEYIPKAQAMTRSVDKWGCYQCSESEVDSSSSKSDDESTQESLEMRLQKLNEDDEGPPYDKWEEFVDVDGSFYYYNAKLNETIHEKPDDYLPDGKETERALEAAENKREYEKSQQDPVVGHSFKDRASVFTIELEESEEENILRIIGELEEEIENRPEEASELKNKLDTVKKELIDFRGYYKIEELLEDTPHKKVVDKFDIAGYDCFQPNVVEKYDYDNAKLIECEFDEESHLRDLKNREIELREHEITKRKYMNEIKDQLDLQGFEYEDGDLVENIAQSGYRTGGVFIIKTDLTSGLLYVDSLATNMDDYGHVGKGFSIGPNRPFCYWNNAKFVKAYWNSNPLPEPLGSKYWHPIGLENLEEFTETKERYGGSKYNVTFCHYELGWGTLRLPGNKTQVMKFLSDQKVDGTELLYFQSVGDCGDGGTDLVELSDQFYYIEGVTN